MDNLISLLGRLLPLLISLASVIVAGFAIRSNNRLACRHAYFDRKAQAYEMFFGALANLAYDQYNPAKRAALTHAVYCALLFSPPDAAKGLNFVAQWALDASNPDDISALDKVTLELRNLLGQDLAHTWTRPISDMHEDLSCEKNKT